MNEETLAKYVKALPGEMLGEYDAMAAGAGANAKSAASGGSGHSGGNRKRFPVLGPVLVLAAAIIVTTVGVIITRNAGSKKNKTELPAATDIGIIEPTPESTKPALEPTMHVTEAPNVTELPATEPPAGTETPAPTDTATQTPEPTEIPGAPIYIEQNGQKIYPYYAGSLRAVVLRDGQYVSGVDILPDDLTEIKENAPVVYFGLPYTANWSGTAPDEFDISLIAKTVVAGRPETGKEELIEGTPDIAQIAMMVPHLGMPGERFYIAVIIHDKYGYDPATGEPKIDYPSYVFCFVIGEPATPTAPATATPAPTATEIPDPDRIRISHLDPIITKGELTVGESVQLSCHASPENYNYGTIRWKLTSGFDCATIDPVTGVLTALKPGSVGVLPYVEEYETKNSPAGLRIIETIVDEFGNEEPAHEQALPAQYRPDADPSGNGWTQQRINIRKQFLVYNGQTPDTLPSYKQSPESEYSYSNSPYENDLTLYVIFIDYSLSGNMYLARTVRQKGVKVTFTDANTGKVVGYSYTNADGVAMFTIKKQEIDFIVSAELSGYNFDHIQNEEDRHIIYPGGGSQVSSGPYTNCGIARQYEMLVNGNSAVEYTFRVVNTNTGEVMPGGIIELYYQESLMRTLDEEYGGYTAVAYDDFFDSIRTITYMYGEGYPKKRVENCTFQRSGNTVTVYAAIPDETPTQIRIERVVLTGTQPTLYIAESLELSYIVTPANANYGTVKFRLTRGEDCAYLDPDTGRLVAIKEGSFAVEAYVEEYEISQPASPVAIQVLSWDSEPPHEQPLPEKFRPDVLTLNDISAEKLNQRHRFVVYNAPTPDILPVYSDGNGEYSTSPYENDYTIYVSLYDAALAEENGSAASIIRQKGIMIAFIDAATNEFVGYSYTNADGIAMFTIKRQASLDLRVSVTMDGFSSDFPHPESQDHIVQGHGVQQYARPDLYSGYAERFEIPIAVE